jgi:hypothetical protein
VHTHTQPRTDARSDAGSGAGQLVRAFSCTTNVNFDDLDEATVRAYVESGEPFGKAGSYGIQTAAGSFVKGISGCYFNVMGESWMHLQMHQPAVQTRWGWLRGKTSGDACRLEKSDCRSLLECPLVPAGFPLHAFSSEMVRLIDEGHIKL